MHAVESTLSETRPPLAGLRRLAGALVRVAEDRCLEGLNVLSLVREGDELIATMVPALDRLREAAEVAPRLPGQWLANAARHFLNACLEVGSSADEGPEVAMEALLRMLTDPLDQGLVVLEPGGGVLAINSRAARALDPDGSVRVGEQLTQPRYEVLYEDGLGILW